MERADGVRVLAIMVVRDEADIVEETLTAAASWADRIFVLDNGSEDGTFDILRAVAARHPDRIAVDRDARLFTDGIRATVYAAHRHEARPGDWWCRLDADEFVVGDPREVLARVPAAFNRVVGSQFKFYLTRDDASAYAADPKAWLQRPVRDRVRWYRNDWAEIRFARHRRLMRWVDTGWPSGTPRVFPERVPFRHYQYRSPAQIERRLRVRAQSIEWTHESAWTGSDGGLFITPAPDEPDWYSRLAPTSLLDYDDGESPLVARPQLLPEIRPPRGGVYAALDGVLSLTGIRSIIASRRA